MRCLSYQGKEQLPYQTCSNCQWLLKCRWEVFFFFFFIYMNLKSVLNVHIYSGTNHPITNLCQTLSVCVIVILCNTVLTSERTIIQRKRKKENNSRLRQKQKIDSKYKGNTFLSWDAVFPTLSLRSWIAVILFKFYSFFLKGQGATAETGWGKRNGKCWQAGGLLGWVVLIEVINCRFFRACFWMSKPVACWSFRESLKMFPEKTFMTCFPAMER